MKEILKDFCLKDKNQVFSSTSLANNLSPNAFINHVAHFLPFPSVLVIALLSYCHYLGRG